MADDDQRPGKIHQEILQPGDGPVVQVVGGLVQQQDVRISEQGLGKQQYSLTTAVGLMKSVLSCGLVLGTNALARKWDSSLW